MLLDLTECGVFQTFTSVNNFAVPGIRTPERPLRSLRDSRAAPSQPQPSPASLSFTAESQKSREKFLEYRGKRVKIFSMYVCYYCRTKSKDISPIKKAIYIYIANKLQSHI